MSLPLEQGIEAIRHMQQRQSCRAFEERPIDDSLLREIISAGLRGASAGNLQPYSILVERDKAQNARISELIGSQPFIKTAAVNLIFMLDWHKLELYAQYKKAPLTHYKSFGFFILAMEDMTCAAQSIETAAHLCGIASCYAGGAMGLSGMLCDTYKLPDKVYPMLLLSLGYPKFRPALRPKLPYDMMVFEGEYLGGHSDAEIIEAFEKKYEGMSLKLPLKPEYREKTLQDFRRALLTTYSPEETERIVAKADADGFISENQRRFGLHYNADDAYRSGLQLLRDMEKHGIIPFDVLKNAEY